MVHRAGLDVFTSSFFTFVCRFFTNLCAASSIVVEMSGFFSSYFSLFMFYGLLVYLVAEIPSDMSLGARHLLLLRAFSHTEV